MSAGWCICVVEKLITYLALESLIHLELLCQGHYFCVFLCFVQSHTVVLLQIITHIFPWPVKVMFRHFAGNVCTRNVSSVILCGLSWHRPGEKCICTGSVSGEVAKGVTNMCVLGLGAVAGKVPRSANVFGSGLMIWFFLLFAIRSSMQRF